MFRLRYITAGESHGKALTGILEGIPAGLPISSEEIDIELKRRQGGYGRGGRMKIESDHAEILSGVRSGRTLGSPIAILIENKDYKNWQDVMSVKHRAQSIELRKITHPRPGHADLAGAMKYGHDDIRNILERSSARETAMRVAIGAIAKKFLLTFNIKIGSYVIQIGSQKLEVRSLNFSGEEFQNIFKKAEKSPVRCPDPSASKKMIKLINKAIKDGNSLGGIFEVFAIDIPVGLGSHIQWDRRLDARLAYALMSIQAIKGVEIGFGFEMSKRFGSEVMDEIFYSQKTEGFYRRTNFAGGIEGGMTNGMPVVLRAAMKPIPTQRKPLRSVDIKTKKQVKAVYERSDICAVPAAGVIGESVVALTLADAFLEKFGGDSMTETKCNYKSYLKYIKNY